MIKNRLLVIGGSDAGISAGLRARELAFDTEVTMILADGYPNFSICGLPFYLSGEISDWKTLAHRTADAMTRRGLAVTVVEFLPSVLTTFDPALGGIVRAELERHGVQVFNGFAVERIEFQGNSLSVRSVAGQAIAADIVLVAVGSRPETALARAIGIETGFKGAIRVNRRMETSLPDIYAAGDCTETYHRLLGKNTYLPLGATAHKQGRIAGENAVGGNREYTGTLGTQSVKIFNLVAARTGLKDDEALKEGLSPLSVDIETWDHKVYYPQAAKMKIRITGDQKTGKLLGAQIIGAYGTEISKRIDTVAAAIHNDMAVEALSDLDLSYTPPLSSPWDPVQMAAQAWCLANRRADRTE